MSFDPGIWVNSFDLRIAVNGTRSTQRPSNIPCILRMSSGSDPDFTTHCGDNTAKTSLREPASSSSLMTSVSTRSLPVLLSVKMSSSESSLSARTCSSERLTVPNTARYSASTSFNCRTASSIAERASSLTTFSPLYSSFTASTLLFASSRRPVISKSCSARAASVASSNCSTFFTELDQIRSTSTLARLLLFINRNHFEESNASVPDNPASERNAAANSAASSAPCNGTAIRVARAAPNAFVTGVVGSAPISTAASITPDIKLYGLEFGKNSMFAA